MESEEKTTILNVRIKPSLKEKAKEKAEKSGLTLAQVIRKMLEDYATDNQLKLTF